MNLSMVCAVVVPVQDELAAAAADNHATKNRYMNAMAIIPGVAGYVGNNPKLYVYDDTQEQASEVCVL